MRTLNALRRRLGTLAALMYLKDYHHSRINLEGSWDDAVNLIWSYGGDEADIMQHACLMDACGSDLWNYKWKAERIQERMAA